MMTHRWDEINKEAYARVGLPSKNLSNIRCLIPCANKVNCQQPWSAILRTVRPTLSAVVLALNRNVSDCIVMRRAM